MCIRDRFPTDVSIPSKIPLLAMVKSVPLVGDPGVLHFPVRTQRLSGPNTESPVSEKVGDIFGQITSEPPIMKLLHDVISPRFVECFLQIEEDYNSVFV